MGRPYVILQNRRVIFRENEKTSPLPSPGLNTRLTQLFVLVSDIVQCVNKSESTLQLAIIHHFDQLDILLYCPRLLPVRSQDEYQVRISNTERVVPRDPPIRHYSCRPRLLIPLSKTGPGFTSNASERLQYTTVINIGIFLSGAGRLFLAIFHPSCIISVNSTLPVIAPAAKPPSMFPISIENCRCGIGMS